jgi:hypothetical protein
MATHGLIGMNSIITRTPFSGIGIDPVSSTIMDDVPIPQVIMPSIVGTVVTAPMNIILKTLNIAATENRRKISTVRIADYFIILESNNSRFAQISSDFKHGDKLSAWPRD